MNSKCPFTIVLPIKHFRRIVRPPVVSSNLLEEFVGPSKFIKQYFTNGGFNVVNKKEPAPHASMVRVVEIGSFAATVEQRRYLPEGTRVMRVAEERAFEGSDEESERFIKEYYNKNIEGCQNGGVVIIDEDCFTENLQKVDIKCKLFIGLKMGVDAVIKKEGVVKISSDCCVLMCDAIDLVKDSQIQVDTSYEKTVADVLRAINQDRFRRSAKLVFPSATGSRSEITPILVVRIGSAAALVLTFDKEFNIINNKKTVAPRLLFHRNRPAPTRPAGLGDMSLYTWIYLAVIGSKANKFIACTRHEDQFKEILACVKAAIYGCHACFTSGFGVLLNGAFKLNSSTFSNEAEYFSQGDANILKMLKTYSTAFEDNRALSNLELGFTKIVLPEYSSGGVVLDKNSLKQSIREVKVDLAMSLSEHVFWRLSSECINWPKWDKNSNQSSKLLEERFKSSEKLVCDKQGAERLPVVRIGKLELIDRFEIQDYLFINGLLQDYAEDRSRSRPLSIAVFGQPGTGKSFGVDELVKAMSSDGRLYAKDSLKFNLSQFRALDDLLSSFQHVRDASLRGSVPLVFFDEFDTAFNGEVFGWLKYFLAPMEDGEFSEGRSLFHLGRCVFVFAGGINHTFAEFNERVRNPEFCLAKGPDFISRLRGVLNIRRINQPDNDEFDDGVYLQRRALVLRGVIRQVLGEEGEMTKDVVKAFMRVSHFKHGVRSLKAIVSMSRWRRGEPLSVGQLPPIDQLAMHVDAREFLGLASS